MAKNITIAGEAFEIDEPYAEGHPLTAAEARALNQVRAENIRNNQASVVRKSVENGGLTEEVRQQVLTYAQNYSFAMPGAGGGSRVVRDPVEKVAREIARGQIKAHLAKSNRKIKDVDKEKLEAELERIASQPDVLKLAKRRVKETEQATANTAEVSL